MRRSLPGYLVPTASHHKAMPRKSTIHDKAPAGTAVFTATSGILKY